MPYKNPKDKKKHAKKYYKNNKEKILKKNREYRVKVMRWFKEYKSTLKCSRCPEDHPACIDFHHKKEKKYLISNMIWAGKSIENIKKEIAKCEIICANCHRKEHYGENAVKAEADDVPVL